MGHSQGQFRSPAGDIDLLCQSYYLLIRVLPAEWDGVGTVLRNRRSLGWAAEGPMNLGNVPGHRKAQARPPWSWGRLLCSSTQSLQEAWGRLLGCVATPGVELLTLVSHSWVTEMGRGHQLPSLASRRQIGWDKKGARHQTMQSKALGLKPCAHASTVWGGRSHTPVSLRASLRLRKLRYREPAL